jgi:penicillin-binding protein 2
MAFDSDRPSPKRATSMFERRMLLVGAVLLVAMGAMTARLFSLTVVSGSRHRAQAESRLDSSALLPTVRGSILDRKGRVLAQSVPSYDLAIFYPAIDRSWITKRAVAAARKQATRATWNRLGPQEREERIAAKERELGAELDAALAEAARVAEMAPADFAEELGRVRTDVEKKANTVWEARLERERAKYGEAAEEQFEARPIDEQSEPHVVRTQLSSKAAFALRKLAEAHPGVLQVQDGTRRVYPWEKANVLVDRRTLPAPIRAAPVTVEVAGIADHVVGSVREEVWPEDLERRPFRRAGLAGDVATDLGGYRPGRDMIGSRGIERTYEDLLRGTRGRAVERLDTGERSRVDPVRGSDLQLTIDIALQAKVQALFAPEVGLASVHQWQHGYANGEPLEMPLEEGTPLNGAAVVLDIDSGEVLAMVSWPTVAAGEAMGAGERRARAPAVNRATESPYPPGSTVKPIVYVSAVRAGVFGADDQVECSGHYFPDRTDICRCWIYRSRFGFDTHTKKLGGPLAVEAAISRSCNIFFYSIGDRMGLRRLATWYRDFGLGEPLDVGLGRRVPVMAEDGSIAGYRVLEENAGRLPSARELDEAERRRDRVEALNASIGQGLVGWTPLQAANAYAILARGGLVRDPEILKTAVPDRAPRRTGNLALNPRSADRALEGLRQAVEEKHGTGHRITYRDGSGDYVIYAPGVRVWAKTGTATVTGVPWDDDRDGTVDRRIPAVDHGWFVGLVGEESQARPRYALAVVLEYGGSGGRSAGPIANQVIHALVDEGYLQPEGAPARRSKPPEPRGDDWVEPVGGAG